MKISLTYRLQPLLELKKRAKQRAEIELARAIALLEEGKKRLKRLEEEKQEVLRRQKECRLKLHEKVASGRARIRDGSFRVNFLRKLEEDEKVKQTQIEAQQKRIEECETAVKRARRDYINAVKELRIMEKHPIGAGARVIGRVVEEPDPSVVLKTVIGGQRIVDMLTGEQLPRIC